MRGTKKREIGSGSRGGKRENGGPRAEKEYRTGNRIVPFTSLISFGPPFFVPLFGNYPYPGPGGRSSPPSVSRFEVCPQYHPQLRISSILPRILQKICPLFFVWSSSRCVATRHRFALTAKLPIKASPPRSATCQPSSGPVSATRISLEPS